MPWPRTSPGLSPAAILLCALALSIGWGVRGNWGHEFGALIPGALSAMAVVLTSGRADWQRRIAYFAFFGALGWSFGGSISYMQVIAYTHSGDAVSVLYGFACLFFIGFLWGAIGGAGTALPAYLDRQRLTEAFAPILAVFSAWMAEDAFFWLVNFDESTLPDGIGAGFFHFFDRFDAEQFEWYDTDWIAALLAAAAVLVLALVRRRLCWGSRLVLYLSLGWWLGFTVLTLGLGLRMTPPRGDNWAGAMGMTAAMFLFLHREGLLGVAWAALVVGLFGGLGFSGATFLKLAEVTSAWETNWHSILEQTYGFISGLGVAVAMGVVSTRAAATSNEPPDRRWTETFAVAFVMLGITYLNIRKNVEAAWLPSGTVPKTMYGLGAGTWFHLAYLALAVSFLWLWFVHRRRRLELVPATPLGKGQLFFLIFLWWIVIGNLARTPPFAEQRLVTEGVIHLNACLCTLLVLLVPRPDWLAPLRPTPDYAAWLRRTAIAAAVAAVLIVIAQFTGVRALWGDQFAGHAGLHIRFGPRATTDKP